MCSNSSRSSSSSSALQSCMQPGATGLPQAASTPAATVDPSSSRNPHLQVLKAQPRPSDDALDVGCLDSIPSAAAG